MPKKIVHDNFRVVVSPQYPTELEAVRLKLDIKKTLVGVREVEIQYDERAVCGYCGKDWDENRVYCTCVTDDLNRKKAKAKKAKKVKKA